MYIYVHICVYIYIYICIYVYSCIERERNERKILKRVIQSWFSATLCVCARVRVCVCVYACLCVRACVSVCLRM